MVLLTVAALAPGILVLAVGTEGVIFGGFATGADVLAGIVFKGVTCWEIFG